MQVDVESWAGEEWAGEDLDKGGTSNNDGAGARLWQLWGGCGLLVKERLWTRQQPGSAPCVALQTNSAKPSVGIFAWHSAEQVCRHLAAHWMPVHVLVRDSKAATCRVMPWASAAGASVGGGVAIDASPASMLPQVQAGLSTDATRSIAIADMLSAARIIGPGAAHPRGPLPALCAPRVTSRAAPPGCQTCKSDSRYKKGTP